MTKPTNTPIDPTRRHLLTIAAGGAVAAAIPADARAYPGPDPIYAAIDADRKAAAVEQAVWAEFNRLSEIADEKVGPNEIEIPSMIEPGNHGASVELGRHRAGHPDRVYLRTNDLG